MQELKLVRPLPEHRLMCEAMMDEWEAFGGRMNPGAIRRFSNLRHQNVTYEEWLKWTEEEPEQMGIPVSESDPPSGIWAMPRRCFPRRFRL